MGCRLLLGLLFGYPSIMAALALMREYKVLGRLYASQIGNTPTSSK
jgi:hypothetical protein